MFRSQKPAARSLFSIRKVKVDFTELIDLASERLGGAVLTVNDEFFAPKENLLKAAAPIFLEGEYTDRGKWMDGWETRRRRTPGFDWCIIRLGLPGVLRGVIVDTSYFRGNYPEHCSLEAATFSGLPSEEDLTNAAVQWIPVLPQMPLAGDSQNSFPIDYNQRVTHLRLKIYPDGGVARLRVYGEVAPNWDDIRERGGEIDLAAVENGGIVLSCSDMFFGHRHNLIMPGRGVNMSDGWETKRRRGPGHDWVIIKLGARGQIRRVEVDTSHFKGNFPESCSLEAYEAQGQSANDLSDPSVQWANLLPRTSLQAHTRHMFFEELLEVGPASHVRFNIFPDGGVSRLRVYGKVS
jgi:allantoicase